MRLENGLSVASPSHVVRVLQQSTYKFARDDYLQLKRSKAFEGGICLYLSEKRSCFQGKKKICLSLIEVITIVFCVKLETDSIYIYSTDEQNNKK
jgi:hypothetical protein